MTGGFLDEMTEVAMQEFGHMDLNQRKRRHFEDNDIVPLIVSMSLALRSTLRLLSATHSLLIRQVASHVCSWLTLKEGKQIQMRRNVLFIVVINYNMKSLTVSDSLHSFIRN